MNLFKKKREAISLGPLFKHNRNEKLSRFIDRERAKTDPLYFADCHAIINMLIQIDIERVPVKNLEHLMGSRMPKGESERFDWQLNAEIKLRQDLSHKILVEYLLQNSDL